MTATDTLLIKHCPTCHIQYAAPKAMFDRISRDGGNWYCPNGHSLIFSESESTKLKKELDRRNQDIEWYSSRATKLNIELQASKNRERSQKAAKTRLMNRVKNGVCPCCNRTFKNLAEHMKTKHPETLSNP